MPARRFAWPLLVLCALGLWVSCGRAAAPTVTVEDPFAVSVATQDDSALVGAPGDGDSTGSLHAYERRGGRWTPVQTLSPPELSPGDGFGHAVDVSADVAVVGLPHDDDLATDSGAVWVLRRQDGRWVPETKLTASDGTGLDFFGWSVAIDGDVIVVGSLFDDDVATDCGAAYVFHREDGAWVEQQKLVADDAGRSDRFGTAVAVSDKRIVVGAPWADAYAGAAYVYRFALDRWEPEARLVAYQADSRDRFGSAVAVRDDVVIVGAPGDDGEREAIDQPVSHQDSGAVHVYRRTGGHWTGEVKLVSETLEVRGAFGLSVAFDGQRALIGARGRSGVTGVMHVYTEADGTWTAATTHDAGADSTHPFGFPEFFPRSIAPVGRRSTDAFAATAEGLAEDFDDLLALVKPNAGEAHWERIDWHVDLTAARARAVEEDKPLLLWRMVGEPLGFC